MVVPRMVVGVSDFRPNDLDNPRSVPTAELLSFMRSISNREAHTTETPAAAWQLAQRWAGPDDLIAITGSFFLVAELRELVLASV